MPVDTHAHLQWQVFDKDLPKVLDRARKADVTIIASFFFRA